MPTYSKNSTMPIYDFYHSCFECPKFIGISYTQGVSILGFAFTLQQLLDKIFYMKKITPKPLLIFAFLLPLLFVLGALCLITVISALFQGGIMSYLGFTYTTIPSFFLFFCASYIVGIPVELFAQSLPRALSIMETVKLHGPAYFGIMISIETLGYTVIMMITDALMTSITATSIAIVVASFAMALIDAWMDYRLPNQISTDEILKNLQL